MLHGRGVATRACSLRSVTPLPSTRDRHAACPRRGGRLERVARPSASSLFESVAVDRRPALRDLTRPLSRRALED